MSAATYQDKERVQSMHKKGTQPKERQRMKRDEQYGACQQVPGTSSLTSRPLHRLNRRFRDAGLFLLLVLFGMATILMLVHIDPRLPDTGKPSPAQPGPSPSPHPTPTLPSPTPLYVTP